ncbi:MAG TPA: hypothetical protein VNT79_08070 [Phycisphaerae bacterium]|nr:hypothetical protein [Phycisphaerae bacterium]
MAKENKPTDGPQKAGMGEQRTDIEEGFERPDELDGAYDKHQWDKENTYNKGDGHHDSSDDESTIR